MELTASTPVDRRPSRADRDARWILGALRVSVVFLVALIAIMVIDAQTWKHRVIGEFDSVFARIHVGCETDQCADDLDRDLKKFEQDLGNPPLLIRIQDYLLVDHTS